MISAKPALHGTAGICYSKTTAKRPKLSGASRAQFEKYCLGSKIVTAVQIFPRFLVLNFKFKIDTLNCLSDEMFLKVLIFCISPLVLC